MGILCYGGMVAVGIIKVGAARRRVGDLAAVDGGKEEVVRPLICLFAFAAPNNANVINEDGRFPQLHSLPPSFFAIGYFFAHGFTMRWQGRLGMG